MFLAYIILLAVLLTIFRLATGRVGMTFGARLGYVLRNIGSDIGAIANVEELEAAKLAHIAKARDIAAKAEADNREFTDEERAELKSEMDTARDLDRQAKAARGDQAVRDEINALGGTPAVDSPLNLLGNGKGAPGTPGKSLGETFTDRPEFVSWLKSVAPAGNITPAKRVGSSPAMPFGMKDLVTGGSVTSAGALVNTEWLGLLDGLAQFQRPLTVAGLVTRGTTGSDQVEYARVTGATNNAAPVAEALTEAAIGTNIGGSIGTVSALEAGQKPKSALVLEKKTADVKTIAHWIPATKRALSDAGQIRTLIDSFLRYGLDEELEDQIVTGDDSGENFEGILEVSGTQEQAFDTDLLTTARKARTLVRTVGRATPTAYVFNPIDNEAIDLTKNLNGDFYFGGPTSNPSAPLWGLPRVESEAVPEGTGIVADWRQAILWDREQAAIAVTDSHEDYFVRNLVAILAEMRAAFGVIRPAAFVTFETGLGSGS